MRQLNEEYLDKMVKEYEIKCGFTPMELERDLLIERVTAKDWSGIFLGKCFVSMYRNSTSATLNLTDVCNLDAEGKRLLFQVIFARDVQGWSDQFLYEIEQEIIEILGIELTARGIIKGIK